MVTGGLTMVFLGVGGSSFRDELQKNERITIKLIDKVALMHWAAIEQRCAIEEHLHNPVD